MGNNRALSNRGLIRKYAKTIQSPTDRSKTLREPPVPMRVLVDCFDQAQRLEIVHRACLEGLSGAKGLCKVRDRCVEAFLIGERVLVGDLLAPAATQLKMIITHGDARPIPDQFDAVAARRR